MALPKLACICCTYARPQLLEQAVYSYCMQNYPDDRCELIVLDDAGQYVSQSHSTPKVWHLISIRRRFRTLGEKRNASAALASPSADAYVVWDDDDIYLPWTLRAHAAALERAPWSLPSVVLVEEAETYRLRSRRTRRLFHPAWAFLRDAFRQVGGYPFMQSGQDQGLASRFEQAGIGKADPLALGFAPYLVYRWSTTGSWHLSALNKRTGYDQLAEHAYEGPPIQKLEPNWPRDYGKAKLGHATPPWADERGSER